MNIVEYSDISMPVRYIIPTIGFIVYYKIVIYAQILLNYSIIEMRLYNNSFIIV